MAKKNGTAQEKPPQLIDVLKKQVRPDSESFLVIGEGKATPGQFAFGVSRDPEQVAVMLIGFIQQLHPEIQRRVIDNLPDAAPPRVEILLPNSRLDS